MSDATVNIIYKCVGVKDSSPDFLQYLDKQKIALGSTFRVLEKDSFDDILHVEIDNKKITISNKIATNLYLQ